MWQMIARGAGDGGVEGTGSRMPREPEGASSLNHGCIQSLQCQGQGKPWQHHFPSHAHHRGKNQPIAGKRWGWRETRGRRRLGEKKSEISSFPKISQQSGKRRSAIWASCLRGAGAGRGALGVREQGRGRMGERVGGGPGEGAGALRGVCPRRWGVGRGGGPATGTRAAPPVRPPPPQPPPPAPGPGRRQGRVPEQPPLLPLAGWLTSQLTPAPQPRRAALAALPRSGCEPAAHFPGRGAPRK